MSDDKNENGMKVEEHRIDPKTLDVMARRLITRLENFQRQYVGFSYGLTQEKNDLLIFTNILVADQYNLMLKCHEGRVAVAYGTQDEAPFFHYRHHRVKTIEAELDRRLKRPNALGYRIKSGAMPNPT